MRLEDLTEEWLQKHDYVTTVWFEENGFRTEKRPLPKTGPCSAKEILKSLRMKATNQKSHQSRENNEN